MQSPSSPRANAATRLAFEIMPAGVFLGFLALILILGGSPRGDTLSLLIIRPIAALVLTYGLVQMLGTTGRATASRQLAFPISALASLAVLAALQLIPLPPSIWTTLPGREPLVAGQEAAQIGLTWQPLSVAPMATINALGAFLVPLAVLVMFAVVDDKARKNAATLVCGFVGLTAVVAAVQAMAPGSTALHFYRVTNADAPVGLFANRNHQAVLLAATIPLILAFTARQGSRKFAAAGWAAALCMAGLAVMTGSRAGAVLAIAALAVTPPLFSYGQIAARGKTRGSRGLRLAIASAPILLLIAVGGLFMVGGGAAFERLAEKDSFGDLRFQILPDVLAMISHSMPLGWGFGSFPEVYEIYERREMIQPAYINHAHNDWLEIIIEGGVGAPLIVLGLAGWTMRSAWRHRRQIVCPRGNEGRLRFAAFAGILILIMGSAFDYPLRTPAGAAIFAMFLGLLATSPWSQKSSAAQARTSW